MKIKVETSTLLTSIKKVNAAVPSKTTMPILETILFEAKDNSLKLSANDMTLGISTFLEADVIEEGNVCIDATIISSILNSFNKTSKAKETYITVEDNKCTISSGKLVFNDIAFFTSEKYPQIDFVDKNDAIIIDSSTFIEAISKTIFSVAVNNKNKIMSGEYIKIENNILSITSLDGYRISCRKTSVMAENKNAIIPAKALKEICKLVNPKEQISIYITDKHALFSASNLTITTRLIDGNYFQVEQMIPNDFEIKIKISKSDLLDAVNNTVFLLEEKNMTPVILEVADNKMNVSLKSKKASFDTEIDCITTGETKIAFKPQFLQDMLSAIEEDEVELLMNNSKSPLVIKADDYLYLILPVYIGA